MPEYLKPRAHREHHRAAVDGPPERARADQLGGRQRLLRVLTAAEEIDVGRFGYARARVYAEHLGGQLAPCQPALEHERVADVAVGAK